MIDSKYMSVQEMSEYMHVGINKAYKMCKDPSFPVIRVGTKILVDKEILDSVWIKNKQITTVR